MDQPAADFGAVRTPLGARTPPQLTSLLPPPPPIPDHELLQLVGRGSYGQVWLARNRLGTLRAVKIVSREAFDDRKPFEREFKGIQRFEPVSRSHEGLVDILQVGGAEEYFYYVMELADEMGRAKGKGRRAKGEGRSPKAPTGAGFRPPRLPRPRTAFGLRTPRLIRTSNIGLRTSTSPAHCAPSSSASAGCPWRNACASGGCWRRRSVTCTGTTSCIGTSSRRTSSSSKARPSWRTSAWWRT